MIFNPRNIDEEGTRAAARALYGGEYRGRDFDGTAPIAEILDEARPAGAVRLSVVPLAPTWRPAPEPPPLPAPAPRPALKAAPSDQIEDVLRSAPQVCGTCKLLSNEPTRECSSPRGHYFVTDYAAMAAKVRAMPR